MRSREDIQAYIERSELVYRELDEDTWIVQAQAAEAKIVVRVADPLVLFRVKVMELDSVSDRPGLFERLLQLNTAEMVHGAYGISDGAVVITAALVLESVDYEEFQGVVDDLSLALSKHYETLASYRAA